jgi:hypothetical protein
MKRHDARQNLQCSFIGFKSRKKSAPNPSSHSNRPGPVELILAALEDSGLRRYGIYCLYSAQEISLAEALYN